MDYTVRAAEERGNLGIQDTNHAEQTIIIVLGTVVSGSLNSVLTKYQDMQCVGNCDGVGEVIYFDQPVLQTLQMFSGEMLCWIPLLLMKCFLAKPASGQHERSRLIEEGATVGDRAAVLRRRPTLRESLVMAVPSMCDLLGTTLMNVGLVYTPVSVYQMTRGSIILIVGLMSVMFLQKRITKLEWVSLFVVFLGVFLVGLSGYLSGGDADGAGAGATKTGVSFDIVIGMTLVFLGITLTAVQFVVEEHILTYLKVEPVEIVGYEGLYGVALTTTAMTVGWLAYGQGYFDLAAAFRQMFGNPVILLTTVLIMVSICLFNFCGISLTYLLNATSRSTIDTSRTLLVWLISMALGWESFHWLQMLAFGLLVGGTLAFNGVIQPENWSVVPAWLKDLEENVHT